MKTKILSLSSLSAFFCLIGLCTTPSIASAATSEEITCPSPAEFNALPAPDETQKTWIASSVYHAVKSQFGHQADLPASYDMEAAFKQLIKAGNAAKTRLDFDKSLWVFFASLHNGHTRFYDELALCQPSAPFAAQKIGEKWIITQSYLKDLPAGMAIMTINGTDFDQWASTIIPYIADSSVRGQQQLLFTGQASPLWPQNFTLKLENGASFTLDRKTLKETSSMRGIYYASEHNESSLLRPDLLYIALPGFEDPDIETRALAILKKNLNIPTILFDVRGNGGGTTPLTLLKALIHHPFQDLISTTPLSIAINDAYSENNFSFAFANTKMQSGGNIIAPDHPLYNGRVYVLQDRVCASACEDFTRALQRSKSGIILGETSWGMDGAGHINKLPETHMEFIMGTERLTMPEDGKAFDGVGVIPDIDLPIIPAKLNSGKDTILEEALDYIDKDKH